MHVDRTRVVAIIQARTGSTRLPGKVLLDLAGEPMLIRVMSRVCRARTLDEVIVATTTETSDDAIVDLCTEHGWPCFRGSEHDVLDRYYRAAAAYQADAVVRITSDCPLIDPQVIDKVIGDFCEKSPDYASNRLVWTYPRGLDTECMTRAALESAWRHAEKMHQRVHVTPYIYENPQLFSLLNVANDIDCSQYRWTVDTIEDLMLVRAIYEHMKGQDCFSWKAVLELMENRPELAAINSSVKQKRIEEG